MEQAMNYDNSPTLILISGHAQHGKTTFAEFIEEKLLKDEHSALIVNYGDLVKYICEKFYNWDGKKDEKGRSLLQYVGTDIARTQDDDFWVNNLMTFIDMFTQGIEYILIPDVRFQNELRIPWFKYETIHVRIDRPDFDNGLTEEQKNHITETALDDIEPDHLITNDGNLTYLKHLAEKFVDAVLYEW